MPGNISIHPINEISPILSLISIALIQCSLAAASMTDFESTSGYGTSPSNIHVVQGCTSSDTTYQCKQIYAINANRDQSGNFSQALLLGDASAVLPSGSSVSLGHGHADRVASIQLSFDFIIWAKNEGSDYGSNFFVLDNLSIVPESSSLFMFALADAGFLARRIRS